ncbi:N-acetylmuramoyl-L-alanine amidase [Phormidium tenue]|uniref:N-acetylmuramoyl-L-alanine amidase n=1 Tax=Phormidium tenue NIES-30 TaxID=549789 RepID=A0A1U7J0T0_9CYAN|nr:N-acetylmuramoyl-L-alanine amidase [Phormidium tenue]MBD2234005.1 N-acetylmuramoyl-L-alanine amidase [Phormidium tenue FACHB-1052]OKH45386.1 N-acetylmuramoyl-L-alanine amidase [Phormidium tenue NIES-30]
MAQWVWGAAALAGLSTVSTTTLAQAQTTLQVVYPPDGHQTTAEQIFFIGTGAPDQPVLLNGEPIEGRSAAGHFAPSRPLTPGPNTFTLTQGEQTLSIMVTRVASGPVLPETLGFAEGSLLPGADIARQPGDWVCLGAVAPANATVTAALAGQLYTLLPQGDRADLPPNSAVLTDQASPIATAGPSRYESCFMAEEPGDFGQPVYRLAQGTAVVMDAAPGSVSILNPNAIEVVEVTAAAGVTRTGPTTDYSRLTPLPQGTRARVTGREGDWLRLDYGGWIRAAETQPVAGASGVRSLIRGVTSRQIPGWTEIYFPLQVPVPVSVEQGTDTFTLTLHNTVPQTDTIYVTDDGLVERLDWNPVLPDQVEYRIHLKPDQQWGYKLRYEGTTLVLSLKQPPSLQASGPLAGTTILVDPGHGGDEPGSRGPNGTPEKDVNLAVSLLLQAALEARGAQVIMTRTDDRTVGVNDRPAQIAQVEPTLALSIHYNALPDSGDAQNTAGIGAFWFHTQAHSLAQFLHDYLVTELDRPSYGVFWNNLALTRPHVAPSVLLELGFMINPNEFEWVTDPQEQAKLAETLAEGVELWVQQTGGGE